jgi:hypothetical protein
VTASEIRNFLDAVSAPVTLIHDDFITLLSSGTLVKDVVYKITDKNLYVRAMSNRAIEGFGLFERQVPNWIGYIGGLYYVWTPDAEPALNDKMIFGEKVYKNISGAGSATIPPDDLDNWEEVAGSTVDYKTDYYGCGIMYRRDGNNIQEYDIKTSMGNVLQTIDFTVPSVNSRFNNSPSMTFPEGSSTMIEGNVGIFLFVAKQNRGTIIGNSSTGSYPSNFGVDDNFLGEFKDNHVANVNLLLDVGNKASFKFNRNIVEMKRVGSGPTTLNLRLNAIIENCLINSKGSNAIDTLDGSLAAPSNVLDLNFNGTNDAYGIFEITTADITIDSLSGFPSHFEKIILRPANGIELSYTANPISANDQICDNGISRGFPLTIYGVNGDYLEIEKRMTNGFNVYYVKPIITV